MHNTSDKYLLQIHPKTLCTLEPVNDELTGKMERLLSSAKDGTRWRGWHLCTGCGEQSGCCDLVVGGYTTNSLAAHYLRWHRDDVPQSELNKLEAIIEPNGLTASQIGLRRHIKAADMVVRKREYLEAIKPFVQLKVQIYARAMPTIIVHEDGEVEHKYNFPEEVERTLKQIDENIEYVVQEILNA